MGVKFFGQFLVDRGVITAETLLECLDWQNQNNENFGEICVRMGLLTEAQVKGLHAQQRGVDARLGELAVKTGMLDQAQLDHVLTFQRNARVPIGETLVKRGLLDRDRLDRELEAFARDQQTYNAGIRLDLPEGVKSRSLIDATVGLTNKLLLRLAGMPAKLGGYRVMPHFAERHDIVVSIGFSGKVPCDVYLMTTATTGRQIAIGVLGFDPGHIDAADRLDGVREFFNVIGGNICGKMAELGLAYDISPTKVYENFTAIKGRPTLVAAALHTPSDVVSLVFAEG